jgi:hypothetical protein
MDEGQPSAPGQTTLGPRRIAFGAFPSWEAGIRLHLDGRFEASFVDLDAADPADFDAVIPLHTDSYAALELYPRLAGSKFFHPAPTALETCRDKAALNAFLQREGFGRHVPRLRGPGPPYPYIRKARYGGWGVGCRIIAGPDDELGPDPADDAYCQELILGELEYATHILRTGGQVRYAATMILHQAGPAVIHGAYSSLQRLQMYRGSQHLDLFADILARLDYEGTACIDYKLVDGQPMIFEINPRFGASLAWDINAYVDAYLAALAPV